jgi:hypothetical protein
MQSPSAIIQPIKSIHAWQRHTPERAAEQQRNRKTEKKKNRTRSCASGFAPIQRTALRAPSFVLSVLLVHILCVYATRAIASG